jgi:hypothetical protein
MPFHNGITKQRQQSVTTGGGKTSLVLAKLECCNSGKDSYLAGETFPKNGR